MTAQSLHARGPRRQQLLDIASQMFARRGFAGTGVDEIGQAAGITGPALYRHFANKQAILDALIIEEVQGLVNSMQGVAEPGADPNTWLDTLIKKRLDFAFGPNRYAFVIRRNEYDNLSHAALRKVAALEELYMAEWLRAMAILRPGVPTTVLRRAVYAVHIFIGYIALEEHIDDVDVVRAHVSGMVRAALFA